ncbi:MAG: class I SAM-dependent methyltransferase [Cyanobacteriota bacterium]|nr:class I SAM-dependent methyltransferase [Cyanobacteriota bacterium]
MTMGIKVLVNQLMRASGHPRWKGWTQEPGTPSERFPTTEEFLATHVRTHLDIPLTSSLDLGCGMSPRNPFRAAISKGIDLNPHEENGIVACDLSTDKIPFDSNTFDYITAFDFIEHVPRVALVEGGTRYPFIDLMNEIYRVLKPGGFFFSSTPAYPCKEAFQDPTHTNIITEDTFPLYFCNETWAKNYGFRGSFVLSAQEWCRPSLLTLIQKSASNPESLESTHTSA